ncbi:serine/threonine-protein kinase [Streptomyces sp. NBC_00572]|uniref:serine/threonine-protein kinase n=1 Tax=Streptomyces sp. NBC_00572 TaxID=2903664 RepID=UPI00224D1DD7|nr:serine/threonine-protein kinase [Streptomyces sp. NBC_00572]MCX4986043.1 serine/threonine protein kinase [Streptomyces sp. NBC_00572]
MGAWVIPGYVEARELGAGGSGRVVLARHEVTGLPVAVKYLSERFRSDEAFVRGFRSEARLLGALDSPYVVGFYEYVEAPRGAAIVMELVDGVALRALIAREGSTGPEAALVVLKGSLLGLAAAHRAGVVHRDYKPENVLVATDGSSKLVDFGIAAGRGATPGVAGTPAYMAPEQWNGAPASPAADVYAATATFFECLTGRKPFSGDNFAELALQHLDTPVPDGEAPEPLRPLIRRGLAKSPHERPENAAAFVTELESVATAAYGSDWEERGRGRLAALAALLPLLFPSSGGGASESTTALATTTMPAPPPRSRWRFPRGVPAGAAALLLALLLALAARAGVEAADGDEAAQAFATTSTGPGTSPPEPGTSPPSLSSPGPELPPTTTTPAPSSSGNTGPSATPAGSPTDETTTATATVAPPPTSSGSASPTAPTSTPTSPSTATPPTPTPTTTPAPPPVTVTAVSVTSLRQTGPTAASGTVEVTTDGTGPVTIYVEWFTGDEKGAPGTPDGSETYRREGATSYTLTLAHDVRGAGCYWGLRATTYPAASNGGSLQQIFIRRCTIS